MSENKNIATHIDRSVIYLFIAIFLIATTTWAFRYASISRCDEALFEHSANAYRVGELIKFYDKTVGAEEWEWDFGDGSEVSHKKNPLHTFADQGDYKVRLLVNGNCQKTASIHIAEKIVLLDSTKFPKFELPKSILVGEKLTVADKTKNASSWEWRFGETKEANAKTKIAEYTYQEPGLKTVSLIVNDDLDYISNKKINVMPLPESNERVKKMPQKKRDKRLDLSRAPDGADAVARPKDDRPQVVPFITKGNFENKIKMIANERLKPQDLSEFFCEDTNPLVEVNGRSDTFLVFCGKIKGKKINIQSLNLERKAGSNCIKTFSIAY